MGCWDLGWGSPGLIWPLRFLLFLFPDKRRKLSSPTPPQYLSAPSFILLPLLPSWWPQHLFTNTRVLGWLIVMAIEQLWFIEPLLNAKCCTKSFMKAYYRDPHRLLELVKKCFAEEMTFEVYAKDIWRHSARGNHMTMSPWYSPFCLFFNQRSLGTNIFGVNGPTKYQKNEWRWVDYVINYVTKSPQNSYLNNIRHSTITSHHHLPSAPSTITTTPPPTPVWREVRSCPLSQFW